MIQTNNSKHSDYLRRMISETGVMAGLLLLLFSWLSYTFHFMNWNPVFMLAAFPLPLLVKYGIALVISVLISIVLSLLYYALFRKRKPFPVGISITVFFFLFVFFGADRSLLHLATIFSLLLGYFLFISLTISWHYERAK
ncbi:YqhR family membrane protein [Domibacillus sp.]|uniref:YqhR family membrane protein n=1 Tax=Domibacillus sp. TaxID=1969783 RepID=UPI002810CF82|nr:YqhR family membrane protein [Domibacillus sp.]